MVTNSGTFVRNFKVIVGRNQQPDGSFAEVSEYGEDSRWYAIQLAHTLEVQGWIVLDIQKLDKKTGQYQHDVSEPNEARNLPARDSMEVLRERYAKKEVQSIDMTTADRVGEFAALTKTLAGQARKGNVEPTMVHQFASNFFSVARLLGVTPQSIMEYSVAQYPELQPRRRQEANA